MLQRCFVLLAVKQAQRSAPSVPLRPAAAAAAAGRSRSKPRTKKAEPPSRRGTASLKASAAAESTTDEPDVSLKSISASLVVPQEPPVRSPYQHPTDFLGSSDPLLLTPAEKAEAEKAEAAQAAEAAAAAEAALPAQRLRRTSVEPRVAPLRTTATATRHAARAKPGARAMSKKRKGPPNAVMLQRRRMGAGQRSSFASTPKRKAIVKSRSLSGRCGQQPSQQQLKPLKHRPVQRTTAARIRVAAAATLKNTATPVKGREAVAVRKRRSPPAATIQRPVAARVKGMRLAKKPVRRVMAKTWRTKRGWKKRW
ncbi:hypothetical protein NQL31_001511 [Lotmaria passim]